MKFDQLVGVNKTALFAKSKKDKKKMTKNKKNQFSKYTAGLYVRFLVPLFQKKIQL